MKHTISTRWLANPNRGRGHFFIVVFRARMNVLVIINVRILVLIKWSYRNPIPTHIPTHPPTANQVDY